MKIVLFVFIFAIAILAGCNTAGVPTEFSKACSPENEKKYLEVGGLLAQRGSVFCSSTSGRMECGFDLKETADSESKLRVEIAQGSGANTVDKLERGYKAEDVKIRDNAGNPISLTADKVKVTGQMSIGPNVCFMTVYKIEK